MILILDEASSASLYSATSYASYLEEGDETDLLLITNYATEEDQRKLKKVVQIINPTSNGLLEVHAFDLKNKYTITGIYTKQEDLILRAAHLRMELGIPGMHPADAILFRDKVKMKEHLSECGIKVPPFRRVFSPANILQFAKEHGYPLVVKPTLGSASGGIRILNDQKDAETYLESEFYDRIDEVGKMMDYSGDICVEAFMGGTMFHVNGFATNGKLEVMWPFRYMNSNLGFTKGNYYGNLSISPSDKEYALLALLTQKILNSLPCPKYLVFHLELFFVNGEFLVCEIAARRPGGSIALLIDQQIGGQKIFPKLEFRFSNGLPVIIPKQKESHFWIGDVLVPRKRGTLQYMPETLDLSDVTIIPIANVGSSYIGFEMGKLNTAARIVAKSEIGLEHLSRLLEISVERFNSQTKYE